MDVEKEVKQMKEQERQVVMPACFCWPTGVAGRTFWGIILLLTGTIWLLDTIGLAVALLWPLLFIGFGTVLLLGWSRERNLQ